MEFELSDVIAAFCLCSAVCSFMYLMYVRDQHRKFAGQAAKLIALRALTQDASLKAFQDNEKTLLRLLRKSIGELRFAARMKIAESLEANLEKQIDVRNSRATEVNTMLTRISELTQEIINYPNDDFFKNDPDFLKERAKVLAIDPNDRDIIDV